MSTSPLREAVDRLLGDDSLEEFVRSRRPHTPWRRVALDLYDATGVAVTYESLRSWFPDEPSEATA